MTLTVRLEPGLEREFETACRARRSTRSAVVTELIRAYLRKDAPAKSPYELAEQMGLVGGQERAAAAGRSHSRFLKAKLRARPRERRAR